jgi:hypothetical protein
VGKAAGWKIGSCLFKRALSEFPVKKAHPSFTATPENLKNVLNNGGPGSLGARRVRRLPWREPRQRPLVDECLVARIVDVDEDEEFNKRGFLLYNSSATAVT